MLTYLCFILFFFNDPATTEIYTLSLHDALPICAGASSPRSGEPGRCQRPRERRARTGGGGCAPGSGTSPATDRKSTRLNSSHVRISYAVFCLKKKKRRYEGSV